MDHMAKRSPTDRSDRLNLSRGVTMVTNAVMPDQLGGLQRYVRELSSAVAALGIPVTIVSKQTDNELALDETFDDGVKIKRFKVPDRESALYAAAYPAAAAAAVFKAVASADGLVHVHYPLQGLAVAAVSRRYVHTFHAPVYRELLPERRYRLPRAVRSSFVQSARVAEGFVARRAASSIVLTEFTRGELALLAPRAAQRAHRIPAGIDDSVFSPGAPIDHPFSAEGRPLLFTARRLVPRTGVSELVQAMPAVLERRPDARLAIAGDGQLRGEVEELIRRLGLQDHVLLLGRLNESDLLGWYRAATLFVLPTQELEGFGMSTVEALACGTPAVGTPAGGTPEVLGSLDPRLVAASSSPTDIAAAILALVEDAATLESLASRSRAHVVPAMSWSTIATAHLEIYERLASARR
jgi:glycosyltransferase involved in cell wall biosynthesis